MNTVWSFNFMWFIIHHNNILLIIHFECCDCITCMVRNSNMLIVREDYYILRIITADRQSELFLQKSGFCINLLHGDCVFTSCCAEKMFAIRSKCQTGSRIVNRILVMLLTQCRNTLQKFKFRIVSTSIITVNFNLIT